MRTARTNTGGPRQMIQHHKVMTPRGPMTPSLPGSKIQRSTIRPIALLITLVVFSFFAAPLTRADTGSLSNAATALQATGWQLVHEAPSGVYLYTIYFPSRDVGYVTGGPDWNNANNGRGAPVTVSKTIDAGASWTTNSIAKTDGWMRGLTCTDADHCWIAGNNANARILYTTDGAATWQGFSNVSGYTGWLWSANRTGNGTTILAGTTCYDPNDSGAKANWLRATDGKTFSGVQAIPGTYMCYVQWDIECPSAGYCYSAGKNYVWRSQNDGQTWAQTSPGAYRWYGLSCTANSTCWVSGKSPFIKSTTNSGAGWTTNTVNGLGANGQFWDITMIDSKHGYAAGCSDVATDNSDRCLGKGVLYRTDDGLTWNAVSGVPDAKDFMDIWAFSMDDFYLVDFGGKIWHYGQAGGPTVTPRPTSQTTATATPTRTSTATATPTATASPTRADTATVTRTATATATRTQTPIITPSATPSYSPSPTWTASSTATRTPAPTASATQTATALPTATSTSVPSSTPTRVPTDTPTATFTAQPTATDTVTPVPTASPTEAVSPLPVPTSLPTATITPTETETATPTSTVTPRQVRLYLPILHLWR